MKNNAHAIRIVPVLWSRLLDYAELMKPELTGLSVLTALCSFYLASPVVNLVALLWTAVGTLLVGGGAGALNQYIERDYDAMMKRTERRPLPAGRLTPPNAFWFGVACSVSGTLVLLLAVNTLSGILGALTLVSYLFLYTPSKRRTPHATLVGAVPGALPPVIGWAAATGTVAPGAWVMFAILFFWQMPHFLSLAWMYRKDYARAGYRLLTVIDATGHRTSRHIVLHCSLLIPVSLSATVLGVTGWTYALGAALLGIAFLAISLLFQRQTAGAGVIPAGKINRTSRQIFFGSLVYLPVLMILLMMDKL